jgi:GT2 family glycosyltransferase
VKEEYPELEDCSSSGYLVEIADVNRGVTLSFETDEKKTELKSTVTSIERTGRFIKKSPIYAQALLKSLMERGIRGTVKKIIEKFLRIFKTDRVDYTKWAKAHMADAEELKEQREHKFSYSPKFSIVVPLYETDPVMLAEMIKSVKEQSYENWELCLSDGSRNENRLGKIIEKYTAADSRIKYIAKADGPLGIAENTNQAISIATGEYIVLGDHDDTFSPEALFCCASCINEDMETDVIYTDEDKLDSKNKLYFDPNFKPDFNIDLLRSNNYICHMFVAKTELAKSIGLFRHEFDGAQDYDFILRCVEKAGKIRHIPKVLYHWRAHSNSTADIPEVKMYAFESGKKAIEAHYERAGLKAEVFYGDDLGFYRTKYEIKGNPLISIVIPNKDHTDDLKKCMDSIDSKSEYRNYEYIIVENNSDEAETFEFYKEIEKRKNVQVVTWDKGFNFSAINNFGVRFAKGEYLLLLNNDTEIINTDCISQLLGYCQRDDVGIVGARLYYPDDILQHAGVIVGMGGIAGHAFVGLNEAEGLYQSRSKVACDYSAVTAACMMVKKEIYDRVGGLDEAYKVAFNDIDFCMKVRETGALVVYNPNAKLYHYESKSRGLEDTPEKIERFNSEIRLFHSRWPDILDKGDPYYNPNLTLNKADFSVRE